jgi:non-specific serine/threonine protein kinase
MVTIMSTPASHPAPPSDPAPKGAVRWFGRLQLVRLLGRSDRTMAWSVLSAGSDQPLMLVLPRVPPASPHALEQWQFGARLVERLKHPHLAPLLEVGTREGWPFMLHDLRNRNTVADSLASRGMPGTEAAALMQQALLGLAYAHDAGVAHHDPQTYLMLVDDNGQLTLAGAGTALAVAWAEPPLLPADTAPAPLDSDSGMRNLQRAAAERDVLACGVVLHTLLVGTLPLDAKDTGQVIKRMPPFGPGLVRLPWSLAQPLSEPLRAIANRATDRQERQRYRSARTLLSALEGWQLVDSQDGGPLALLEDRLRAGGVLPALPGAAERAARLTMMDRQRTSELAEVVLEDLALSFELLRLVNSAQVGGAPATSSGPVLTVRRAIAMLGLEGVRRAATAIRKWPGPLDDAGARALQQQMARSRRAARLALALRPAGYDTEVVFLVTVLQDLGRLVVRYHFPDEAVQIERLMDPAAGAPTGQTEGPGMTEEGASFAVLGADIEAMGLAVGRYWGLDDSVLLMTRRLPLATPVHKTTTDEEMLRTLASCAHEVVDALALPSVRVNAALGRVLQRYGTVLGFSAADLQVALRDKPLQAIAGETTPGALDALPPARPADGQPRGLGLRAAAQAAPAPR